MPTKKVTIDENFISKAIEFAINRVVYNQQNEVWASAMIKKFLQGNKGDSDFNPERYLQAGVILGYAMRYIECKEKGLT